MRRRRGRRCSEARWAGGRCPGRGRRRWRLPDALVPLGWAPGGPHLRLPQHARAPGERPWPRDLGMLFPAGRCALRWLQRPRVRPLSRAAMEVAFRGVRKILCVAEKNDAAKGIADLLSDGRARRVSRRVATRPCAGGPRLGVGAPGRAGTRRRVRRCGSAAAVRRPPRAPGSGAAGCSPGRGSPTVWRGAGTAGRARTCFLLECWR